MKIRKPWLIKLLGLFGAIVIRLWLSTLRPLLLLPLPHLDPRRLSATDRFIYIFWHENILLPCYLFGRCHINVLISQHADGELITQVCRHLGYGAVRGSKTRGGIQAMRKMLRNRRRCHVAVMPDGPRGPRRHVEMGVVYLAAKTGMPIIVCGIGYDRPCACTPGTASPCRALEQGPHRHARSNSRSRRRRQG